MIGPALYPETGTSVLFQLLVDRMRAGGAIVHMVPIPRGGRNPFVKLLKLLGVLLKTMRLASHADAISAHVPTPQLSNVAFASMIVAALFRRPFIVRKFGGMDPSGLRPHARYLAEKTLRRSDVSFVEARQQCDDITQRLRMEIFWYPNYRDSCGAPSPPHPMAGRFVYVGRVCHEKGIREIVEAVTSLGGRCSVDVYGPCENGLRRELLDRSAHIHYRGVLTNANVPDVLPAYDALLLPTYWEGEGYPGVIIEAFLAGLPVVATRWKFIPEMVDETCGILVEPGDVAGLVLAMERLASDEALARRLRNGALSRAKEFSSDRWVELFVRTCHIARDYPRDDAERLRRMQGLYEPCQCNLSVSTAADKTCPSPSCR